MSYQLRRVAGYILGFILFYAPLALFQRGLSYVSAWKISTNPNAELVNSMLDEYHETLKNGERPIVHSDRGAHYRWWPVAVYFCKHAKHVNFAYCDVFLRSNFLWQALSCRCFY